MRLSQLGLELFPAEGARGISGCGDGELEGGESDSGVAVGGGSEETKEVFVDGTGEEGVAGIY